MAVGSNDDRFPDEAEDGSFPHEVAEDDGGLQRWLRDKWNDWRGRQAEDAYWRVLGRDSIAEQLWREPAEEQVRELYTILDDPQLDYRHRFNALSKWFEATKKRGGPQPDGGFVMDCRFFEPRAADALIEAAERERKQRGF